MCFCSQADLCSVRPAGCCSPSPWQQPQGRASGCCWRGLEWMCCHRAKPRYLGDNQTVLRNTAAVVYRVLRLRYNFKHKVNRTILRISVRLIWAGFNGSRSAKVPLISLNHHCLAILQQRPQTTHRLEAQDEDIKYQARTQVRKYYSWVQWRFRLTAEHFDHQIHRVSFKTNSVLTSS